MYIFSCLYILLQLLINCPYLHLLLSWLALRTWWGYAQSVFIKEQSTPLPYLCLTLWPSHPFFLGYSLKPSHENTTMGLLPFPEHLWIPGSIIFPVEHFLLEQVSIFRVMFAILKNFPTSWSIPIIIQRGRYRIRREGLLHVKDWNNQCVIWPTSQSIKRGNWWKASEAENLGYIQINANLKSFQHIPLVPLAISNVSIGVQAQEKKSSLSLSSCSAKIALGFMLAYYTMVYSSITRVTSKEKVCKL